MNVEFSQEKLQEVKRIINFYPEGKQKSAVIIIFINANGINFFQPKSINWSKRKRGIVHLIQMNTNRKKNIFDISTPKLINVIQNELNPQDASFTKGIS